MELSARKASSGWECGSAVTVSTIPCSKSCFELLQRPFSQDSFHPLVSLKHVTVKPAISIPLEQSVLLMGCQRIYLHQKLESLSQSSLYKKALRKCLWSVCPVQLYFCFGLTSAKNGSLFHFHLRQVIFTIFFPS